jgi:5'-nucleotidase/UDP-sugar diphosphatase
MKMLNIMQILIPILLCVGMGTWGRAEDVRFTLLHFNDVYEIVPPRSGEPGGLGRVAAIRDRLKATDPNTLTVLAGDFLSPSVMSRATFDGKRLAGRQMVDVLNALRPDLVTFGNHEFDLSLRDFADRMNEAKFDWVSSNVSTPAGSPFRDIPRSIVKTLAGPAGASVRVGFIGLTLDSNDAPYVRYGKPIAAARAQVEALRGKYDVLVALTHLERQDDRRLAEALPEIDLILGGHEHVASFDAPNPRRHAPIAKADANVKTVFIHELTYSTERKSLLIRSRLEPVGPGQGGQNDVENPTWQAVKRWTQIGFEGLRDVVRKEYPALETRLLDEFARRQGGERPKDVDFEAPFIDLAVPLDGFERDVRERRTNLTVLLNELMLKVIPADQRPRISVLNCGTIRIDDEIPAGPTRLYDIYRILPYKTTIYRTTMKGALLAKLLDAGLLGANIRGEGAFLQTSGVVRSESAGTWTVDGRTLDPNDALTTYKVALNDYMLRGGEKRFLGILPKRGDTDDLRTLLTLDKDSVEIDKGSDSSLDLLSTLIEYLLDIDRKDATAKQNAFPRLKDPTTAPASVVAPGMSFEFEIRCGLTPVGDGFPGPKDVPTPQSLPADGAGKVDSKGKVD